jgi:Matrixin/Divergent InlB B-repeat domain/Dockerin type I domain
MNSKGFCMREWEGTMSKTSNCSFVQYTEDGSEVALTINKRIKAKPLHFILAILNMTRNMRFISSLLLLLTFIFVSPANAYQLEGYKWPQPTTTFYVDILGAAGLWNDSFETAMNYWGVDTIFEYKIVRGVYEDPCDPYEGRNGVGFEPTHCGDAWGGTTLAICTSWYSGSKLTQADIVFNSNESWDVYSTSWSSRTSDFQRVAVHELGHALGLGHEDSIGVPAIMGTYAGDITIPQQDDVNGVAAIYGFGAVAAPATITVPASDSDGNYTVNWAPSSTAGVTYFLSEATNSAFTAGLRTAYSGSGTSTSITGRTSGVTYYYRVKATKSGYTDSAWVTGSNGCNVASTAQAFTLTASKTGNGTITSSPAGISCGSDCTESYNSGTSVTLTATPSFGWKLTGWGGACSGTGSCTVTMSAAKSVSATFAQTFTLTASKTGNGTITSSPAGISCGSDCTESYNSGTSVTLTATPGFGWKLTGWGGACSGTGICQVTMSQAKNVTATFNIEKSIGDVNGDGDITLADAILSLQVISGKTPAQAVNKAADVNGDGEIGLPEVLYILQRAAGAR